MELLTSDKMIITLANKNVGLSDLSVWKWCLLCAALFTWTPFQWNELKQPIHSLQFGPSSDILPL